MLYQDQLAVIGELPGPGSLRSFSLQQSLFTANLAVGFPTWKTLKWENIPFTAGLFVWRMPKTRKVEPAGPKTWDDLMDWNSVWLLVFALETAEQRQFREKWGKYEGELGRGRGQERATNGDGGQTGSFVA